MNKYIACGRLTRDAEVRYNSETNKPVGRFTLAVDRTFKQEGQPDADFVSCICFGKIAEFIEKFGRRGVKFIIEGRIQTGSYTNKDGQKVYTTDVIIEHMEFAESKSHGGAAVDEAPSVDSDGFMNIPDGIEEELPFK